MMGKTYRRRILAAFTALLMVLSVTGCSRGPEERMGQFLDPWKNGASVEGVQPSEEIDKDFVTVHTQFALNLLQKITAQESGENVVISPMSIAMVLEMLYNGANGDTREAMAQGLGLGGMDLEDLNQTNKELIKQLQDLDPQVEISLANSLWTREGLSLDRDFIKQNESSYQAEVRQLDFDAPDAADIINSWVKQHTRERIEKIIDPPIHRDQVMLLLNALYFKGAWAVKFDPGKTEEQPFYKPDGSTLQHPMMNQSGDYPYYRGEDFQALGLPYGSGKASMYIFLPDEGTNLQDFLKGFAYQDWVKCFDSFFKTKGEISIPKWKLEYEARLDDYLKELGMEAAFDPFRADFSRMGSDASEGNMYIGMVKHKTFVEVNEQGTEAAAVTGVQVYLTSAVEPFHMVVNRPFFFVIRDDETGSILFMGSIVDPS